MSDLYRLPDGRTKLKAHDIRHLCVCAHCDGMADDRETVRDLHPRCFYEMEGNAGVLALCSDDRDKFALGDIPVELMKRLLDQ
jgi:hypothetical protein